MRTSIIFVLLLALAFQVYPNIDTLTIPVKEREFVTDHSILIKGKKVDYIARVGETFLRNAEGKVTAGMWSTSYIVQGENRPVMFVYNGGPGSASVWLHMGLLGPKIVRVDSDADKDDGAAPYELIDNPYAILDMTDIVFIDPIGTGYSDVLGEGKVEDYWGLYEDSRSVATFIRSWITQHKRWNSPKYMAGESFGTTRAAAVAQDLMGGGQDVALNGIIMISQALDYAGSTSDHYNITSYLTYLPAMAATAWYHKKAGMGQSLADFVDKARKFTYDRYAPALYRGDFLSESEKVSLAQELSKLIGLSEKYILQSNLRVLVPRFQKELLRDEGKTIGRLDGRYVGEEADVIAENPTLGDPASYRISSAYTAGLNHYFASELNVKVDKPYLTSNNKIYSKWNWRSGGREDMSEPSYVNTAPRLGNAMRKNEALRVLVASGYYDLITPFFDAEYTFSRNGIVLDHVEFKYFEAGHMMYVHHPDFGQLCSDIRAFITNE